MTRSAEPNNQVLTALLSGTGGHLASWHLKPENASFTQLRNMSTWAVPSMRMDDISPRGPLCWDGPGTV